MKVKVAQKEPSTKKKSATAAERKRKSREKKLKALSEEELVQQKRNESQTNRFAVLNFHLTLPYMGLLSDRQSWGGALWPPIFSRELYIVWSFGAYIHVYTHKLCLHGNFQTSSISPCGAMTSS